MANSEKHKQRSAYSYHKKGAEARDFAHSTWWKNEGKYAQRKSLKERAKALMDRFSRQKKG